MGNLYKFAGYHNELIVLKISGLPSRFIKLAISILLTKMLTLSELFVSRQVPEHSSLLSVLLLLVLVSQSLFLRLKNPVNFDCCIVKTFLTIFQFKKCKYLRKLPIKNLHQFTVNDNENKTALFTHWALCNSA